MQVSGVLLSLFLNNAGGAWDNAKVWRWKSGNNTKGPNKSEYNDNNSASSSRFAMCFSISHLSIAIANLTLKLKMYIRN